MTLFTNPEMRLAYCSAELGGFLSKPTASTYTITCARDRVTVLVGPGASLSTAEAWAATYDPAIVRASLKLPG